MYQNVRTCLWAPDVDWAAVPQGLGIPPAPLYTWAVCESILALAWPMSRSLPSLPGCDIVFLLFPAWFPFSLPSPDPPKFVNFMMILSCLSPCSHNRRQTYMNINTSRIVKSLDFPQLASQGVSLLPLHGCQQKEETPGSETEADYCSQNSSARVSEFVPFLGPIPFPNVHTESAWRHQHTRGGTA